MIQPSLYTRLRTCVTEISGGATPHRCGVGSVRALYTIALSVVCVSTIVNLIAPFIYLPSLVSMRLAFVCYASIIYSISLVEDTYSSAVCHTNNRDARTRSSRSRPSGRPPRTASRLPRAASASGSWFMGFVEEMLGRRGKRWIKSEV